MAAASVAAAEEAVVGMVRVVVADLAPEDHLEREEEVMALVGPVLAAGVPLAMGLRRQQGCVHEMLAKIAQAVSACKKNSLLLGFRHTLPTQSSLRRLRNTSTGSCHAMGPYHMDIVT